MEMDFQNYIFQITEYSGQMQTKMNDFQIVFYAYAL